MIPTLTLIGFYIPVCGPFLGHLPQHGFGHIIAPILDNHEIAFLIGQLALLAACLLTIAFGAFLGFWWFTVDALLLLLIRFRLFCGGH